jgi:hypothetical protein
MKKIPWKWQGNPGHFCCARDCWFRLCTVIGKYMISTVGELVLKDKNGYQDIGFKRKYETMVFTKLVKCTCGCGYYVLGNGSEIECSGYNSSIDAQNGHLEMCLKYERLQQYEK